METIKKENMRKKCDGLLLFDKPKGSTWLLVKRKTNPCSRIRTLDGACGLSLVSFALCSCLLRRPYCIGIEEGALSGSSSDRVGGNTAREMKRVQIRMSGKDLCLVHQLDEEPCRDDAD